MHPQCEQDAKGKEKTLFSYFIPLPLLKSEFTLVSSCLPKLSYWCGLIIHISQDTSSEESQNLPSSFKKVNADPTCSEGQTNR